MSLALSRAESDRIDLNRMESGSIDARNRTASNRPHYMLWSRIGVKDVGVT
jgi:hypothetical protein